jgi:hypothetical protein
MAGTYLPLAALHLTTAVAILAAISAVPVTAAADKYSGRMVIIRAPGARVVSAGGALNKWQQRRRPVEDEVAPEFGGGLLGAGEGRRISYSAGALDKDRPVCLHHNCAVPGKPYTQDHCTYQNHCAQSPTAEPARTKHA